MTVSELIEQLQEIPGDTQVGLEITPSYDNYYGAYANATHIVFDGEGEEHIYIIGDPA